MNRKKWYVMLLLILVMLLSGCGDKTDAPIAVSVGIDGQNGTILFESDNISSGQVIMGEDVYRFTYESEGKLSIIYPDGSRYEATRKDGEYFSSAAYDAAVVDKGYINGLALAGSIESAQKIARPSHKGSLLLIVILWGLGAWHLFAARSAWWLAWGWRYKNSEPSDLAIGLYRLSGGILLFVGLIYLLTIL